MQKIKYSNKSYLFSDSNISIAVSHQSADPGSNLTEIHILQVHVRTSESLLRWKNVSTVGQVTENLEAGQDAGSLLLLGRHNHNLQVQFLKYFILVISLLIYNIFKKFNLALKKIMCRFISQLTSQL